jgi:hypothetical protein
MKRYIVRMSHALVTVLEELFGERNNTRRLHSKKGKMSVALSALVGPVGIEPTTQGL